MPADGATYFKRTPTIRPTMGDCPASTRREASPEHTRSNTLPHRTNVTPMTARRMLVSPIFKVVVAFPSSYAIRRPTRLEEAITGASSDTRLRENLRRCRWSGCARGFWPTNAPDEVDARWYRFTTQRQCHSIERHIQIERRDLRWLKFRTSQYITLLHFYLDLRNFEVV